jgi:hypothetical protein
LKKEKKRTKIKIGKEREKPSGRWKTIYTLSSVSFGQPFLPHNSKLFLSLLGFKDYKMKQIYAQ